MQRKKLTLKQKVFVEKTIETLNPTQAAREAYQLGSKGGSKTEYDMENTAGSIAVENLQKPTIRQEILKRMEEVGLNVDTITSIHKRNIKQSKNYAASNTALDMLYNLAEAYPVQKSISLNLTANLEPEALKQRKKELQEELERIRQ